MDWNAFVTWWGANWEKVVIIGGAMSAVFWFFIAPVIDKDLKELAEQKRQKREQDLRKQELDLRKQELELERAKLDARPEVVPLTPAENPHGPV